MKRADIDWHAAGGAVRDLLLGRKRRDVDFVCLSSPSGFIQSNPDARKIENAAQRIYLVNGQECGLLDAPLGQEDEVLAADVSRRDFTINALLLSPEGVLRCHPDSIEDLRRGVIRPVSAKALLDDPVRVLRAARFRAEFPDFSLHADAMRQMRQAAALGLLRSIAPEQIGRESLKACAAPKPGAFLRCLAEAGALAPWFLELAEGGDKIAGPPAYHQANVLEHTAQTMDAAADLCRELGLGEQRLTALAVWMALCHDLGKCATPREELPRHIGHERRGAALAQKLGERLRLPAVFCKAGKLAAELHMKAALYAVLRPGVKVDMLMKTRQAGVDLPFFIAVAADSGQNRLPETMQRDLARILEVKLPPHWTNKGKASGERLRQMRCQVLAAR